MQMDKLNQPKEEDLACLCIMYKEHLDSTKKLATKVKFKLNKEMQSLPEENKKVKMCYKKLQTEASHTKSNLKNCKNNIADLSSKYQKDLSDSLHWEK